MFTLGQTITVGDTTATVVGVGTIGLLVECPTRFAGARKVTSMTSLYRLLGA